MHSLPFDSAAGQLAGALTGTIPMILIFVCLLVGACSFIVDPDNGKKLLFPVLLMLPGYGVMKVIASAAGVNPVEEPADQGPGLISQGFDWIVSHGLMIAGTVGALGLAGVILTKVITRKGAQARIKNQVRELLAAIDRADQIEEYWHWTSQEATSDTSKETCGDRIATVGRARSALLQLLAGVHNGVELDQVQRRQMGQAVEQVEACAKDSVGITVVPRDGLIAAAKGKPAFVFGTDDPGLRRFFFGPATAPCDNSGLGNK